MIRRQVSKSSADTIEKKKILFQFILMLATAFIGGICFIKAIGADLPINIQDKVFVNFSSISLCGFELSCFIYNLLLLCMPYIVSAIVILAFSFSYISYVVSDIILVLNGFCAGISTALVVNLMINTNFFMAINFVVSTAIALIILFQFAYDAALFSLDIRINSPNGRMILSPQKLLRITVKLFVTFGTFIILMLMRYLISLILNTK